MPNNTPEDSKDFLRVPAMPRYINELGHVRAGHMLKLIDIAACMPPTRHLGPGYSVVTVSVDRTNFVHPIGRWEIISIDSRLTQTWNSSMESQVTVSAWNFRTGETRPIAVAYVVTVGLDGRRGKVVVPALEPVTEQDRLLMLAADQRKANRFKEGKEAPILWMEPEDNPAQVDRLMTSNDANLSNNVFGGVILELMDEVGSLAARNQFLGGTVVGVRMDRMSFVEPAFIGETIIARAIVTKTWLSSMEVQVELSACNPTSGLSRPVGHCYLVYVAVNPEGTPVQVPPFIPTTETQFKRAQDAELRRAIRKQEEATLVH
jgi:acyl-CoA hydrolase